MQIDKTYADTLEFWNRAFALSDEDKARCEQELDPDNGWTELAPCDKLRNILTNALSGQKKVLDYGCGDGWAGIALCKSGCEDVTCADVAENAVEQARFLGDLFHAGSGFHAMHVTADWISEIEADTFDGLYCSNVIDVIPPAAAEEILENFSRIIEADGKIIISMNYCMPPDREPRPDERVENGNELYVNGILRLVSRTDEEWAEILSRWFIVEKISYFAWSGEETEERRIFELRSRR